MEKRVPDMAPPSCLVETRRLGHTSRWVWLKREIVLEANKWKDVLQSISAKSDGEACCQWVGDEGAGHYVKMVHNGIEYGDMQLICEVRKS